MRALNWKRFQTDSPYVDRFETVIDWERAQGSARLVRTQRDGQWTCMVGIEHIGWTCEFSAELARHARIIATAWINGLVDGVSHRDPAEVQRAARGE